MTMRNATDLAFQGDIALLKTASLPDGLEIVTQPLNGADREAYGYHPSKGLVLAQGESRNHFHAFRDTESVQMFREKKKDAPRLFLVVNNGPQTLVHEEHDPITFPDGTYELMFQKEYTFEEEYRRVAD